MRYWGLGAETMSSRTVEAHKAIVAAWEKEQELVRQGKGTRDWTPEQQNDILNSERGKAYDTDGRAFDGQHMKSVAKYPEHQGNPDNIQFLTRQEHLEAHKGSWQNPTNWYYDPVTKQFFDFSENELIPCKIIKLSNPVIPIGNGKMDTTIDLGDHAKKESPSGTDPPVMDSHRPDVIDTPTLNIASSPQTKQGPKEKIVESIKTIANTIKDLPDKHPVLTAVVEVGAGLTFAAIAGKAIGTKMKTNHSGHTGQGLPVSQTLGAVVDTVVDAVSNFDFKKTESFLKGLGYSVAKNIGLSDVDRQKILQRIISSGAMSKEAVCACLENYINLHKNQSKLADAVNKWIADLAYVKTSL